MRKSILFILVAFTFSIKVWGQTALKLNMHLQYQPFEYTHVIDSIYTEVKEGFDLSVLPSPTISFYKENGSFHEIGLSRIQYIVDDDITTLNRPGVTQITNGSKETTFNIGFRYDYNILLSNKENPFSVYTGVSASPSFTSITNEPKVRSYKRTQVGTSVYIGLVPRVIWKINSQLFFDLNIPVNLYELSYKWQKIHNPSLPLKQTSNGAFESTFIPKHYEVRLGVGIML